ncbi:MAG: DUF4065 domain-containing protein [Elusimicrobiota bacterium]|nr:DUF4065 domain-containing protein [Elusimicrobiota bacterium]
MKNYCEKCNKLSEVTVKTLKESYPVKGEATQITAEVAVCNTCGEKLFNHELDGKNLRAAFAAYRHKHSLLAPEDIAKLRKKYQLSQRALGQLLDWGEITINRYENGAIQDPAHNEVLHLISDTRNMLEVFEKQKHLLSVNTAEKLAITLAQLKCNEAQPSFRATVEDFICSTATVDEYSGFAKFDLEKTLSMIALIAEKTKGVFTTKLNKLMWYTDFLHFKGYGRSITGCTYVHLPLGPVPNNYDLLISVAADDKLISKEEKFFSNGMAGVEFKSIATIDKSLFSKEEIKTIEAVTNHFKAYNCKQIKDQSHNEKAYIKTSAGDGISYKYASQISI